MFYMLAIMYDPTVESDGSPSRQKVHQALGDEMRTAGHYRGGAGLAPVETFVKRVRSTGPDSPVLDGPFAETKEALGGYFLVECNEQEAIRWAKRIEHDNRSWVDVRAMFAYTST